MSPRPSRASPKLHDHHIDTPYGMDGQPRDREHEMIKNRIILIILAWSACAILDAPSNLIIAFHRPLYRFWCFGIYIPYWRGERRRPLSTDALGHSRQRFPIWSDLALSGFGHGRDRIWMDHLYRRLLARQPLPVDWPSCRAASDTGILLDTDNKNLSGQRTGRGSKQGQKSVSREHQP